MLRMLLLVLLLANVAYFAWSHGVLGPLGMAPTQQSEPQRLAQQIKPEALRILGSEEARGGDVAATPAARPAECLLAGPLDDAQASALKQVLEPWPAGSWALEPAVEPARWIVYMGKYLTAENVNRKKAELRGLGVSFENLSNPALEPGLSLGGFDNEAAAAQRVEALVQRGVRTARVVQERPEVRGQSLKLAALDDGLRGRLDELKPALNGKNLRPCR